MNKFYEFEEQIKGKTLLGVGPMSKCVTDSVISLANEYKIPILLIASRRQIECEELGGGYVNNWTTEAFVEYVRVNDKGGYVLLARDHGGPFQGKNEKDKIAYEEAMKSCLISYEADIKAGFDIIHIDPSLLHRATFDELVEDIKYLFTKCEEFAAKYNRDLVYETGTEEANGGTSDLEGFANLVREVKKISPKIKFVVGNTGTLVKEMRNVGSINLEQTKELVRICNENGLLLKEHNLDYVDDVDPKVLSQHPIVGIHSANVAPEFGVVETKYLLDYLCGNDKRDFSRFIELAVESKTWEKWLVGDRQTSYLDKAYICGHYIFSHPEIKKMRNKTSAKEEQYFIENISNAIKLYLENFGWIQC